MPDDTRSAPVCFLQTVFEPEDWVAVFLKSYVDGRIVQHVASAVWVASDPVQAWLRAMNAHRFNVYVSVNALGWQRRAVHLTAVNPRHLVNA